MNTVRTARFHTVTLIFSVFVLPLAFMHLSCATSRKLATNYTEHEPSLYVPERVLWQPIEDLSFAEYFCFENEALPIRYHCLKINLKSPDFEVVTFPNDESDFKTKHGTRTTALIGMNARQFSRKFQSALSINATPYGGKLIRVSRMRTISGIHVAHTHALSAPVERYSALVLTKSSEDSGFFAKIIQNQSESACSDCDFAFGGFFVILSQGSKMPFSWQSANSRTALGISSDGRTLYVLVVEGEHPSKSRGLSYPECADIMLALGASDALQMDGGGSSSLFINGKNALSYPALRKNAVFLGFKKLSF